jgi:hypothetical protein
VSIVGEGILVCVERSAFAPLGSERWLPQAQHVGDFEEDRKPALLVAWFARRWQQMAVDRSMVRPTSLRGGELIGS